MFSLNEFNKAMKQKPKEVRAMYAFWFAAVVTGMLALIWIVTIPAKLDRIANAENEEAQPTGNFSNVMQSLRANVSDAVESFQTVKEEIAATPTDTNVSNPAPLDFTTFFEESDSESGELVVPIDQFASTTEVEPVNEESMVSATSSFEVAPEVAREPRQILIGTTSARTSSSSGE
jgi:hypothetical protein